MGSVNMETWTHLNIGWEETCHIVGYHRANIGRLVSGGWEGGGQYANRMQPVELHPVNHFFLVLIT